MGDKDAAVTLDSAWYVALLVGFEACSASCTARALATCPFVCVVAAWELVGGVACALPFWAVGARAPPTLRCFPAGALGAGAALALACPAAFEFVSADMFAPALGCIMVAMGLRCVGSARGHGESGAIGSTLA